MRNQRNLTLFVLLVLVLVVFWNVWSTPSITGNQPLSFKQPSPSACSILKDPPGQYIVVDLGGLDPSEPNSEATDLNERNSPRVTGHSYPPPASCKCDPDETCKGYKHAFLSRNGVMKDLGTLNNAEVSIALGINDNNQVVGYSPVIDCNKGAVGIPHAFLWKKGAMTDLGTLPDHIASTAASINNVGQIVGWSSLNYERTDKEGVLWDHRGIKGLGFLLEGSYSVARDINDAGKIVGTASRSGYYEQVAVLWANGKIINLGNLPDGTSSLGAGINNQDQVVGTAYVLDSSTGTSLPHAFLWENGNMIDLGMLPGDNRAKAWGINDCSDVVGESQYTTQSAFIWRNGIMYDLNTLTSGSGWSLLSAAEINNQGYITGTGRPPNGDAWHGFLLIPQ